MQLRAKDLPLLISGAVVFWGIGLLVFRVGHTPENGAVVMVCPTKHLLVQRAGGGIPAGLNSLDGVVDGLMNQATTQYAADTAGNPFAGLGFALMGAMREPIKQIARSAFDDACANRDTTWLSSLSTSLKQSTTSSGGF